jgi:hypothetical protein
MIKEIPSHVIEEGNIKVVKDTGNFGGCNMWNLYIKDITGWFRDIQWVSIDNAQPFFKTQLPRYREVSNSKFELVK